VERGEAAEVMVGVNGTEILAYGSNIGQIWLATIFHLPEPWSRQHAVQVATQHCKQWQNAGRPHHSSQQPFALDEEEDAAKQRSSEADC